MRDGLVAGIGIDLVSVNRFELAIRRRGSAFLHMLFSPDEQAYAEQRGGLTVHLAGQFAVKEAVSKALGIGLLRMDPTDIMVSHAPGGAPQVRLAGKALQAARNMGVEAVQVSISHIADLAVAIAVAVAAAGIPERTFHYATDNS